MSHAAVDLPLELRCLRCADTRGANRVSDAAVDLLLALERRLRQLEGRRAATRYFSRLHRLEGQIFELRRALRLIEKAMRAKP